MKNVYDNVLESVGQTPLIRINRLNPNPRVTIYAKTESRNPGGSIKDRAALSMIETAERTGELTPDKIIIEATSGNTGIGLAMVAAVKGYRLVLAMAETASVERQKILRALGAELLLTPGALGTDGAIEEVYKLVRKNPERYFMTDQYNNPSNPAAHEFGTGPEIYEQTDGQVDTVVVTLGTTGTAMGILKAMKEHNPTIRVIGVEPYPSHKIQGLKNMKESYVPGIFDRYALDAVVHVRDEDAFEMARRLAREEGIFAGMSSGAAMAAAVQIVSEMESGMVVTVLPDGGDRYLSTNLFTTLLEPDFRFFDLQKRDKVEFKPVHEGKVQLCVTGAPLDRALTLQESRRFLLADVLTRFLEAKGFSASRLVLIPDLESRTVQGALDADRGLDDYTDERLRAFLSDLEILGIRRFDDYPRTSEHVGDITQFTQTLLDKGFAYEKLRSVYFDLSKSPGYGALSRVDPEHTRPGARIDPSTYEKQNPMDFTLLKRATLAELKRGFYIKTRWGNVLPTWHIASAAAAIRQAGSPFDVQISSVDFLFPHLENVRAIGEALTGKCFANTWLVCERVWASREDEGLSGDLPVTNLEAMGYDPLQVRYWMLSVHYRKPLHVSRKSLDSALRGFQRLQEFLTRLRQAACSREDNPALPEHLFALEQNFFDSLADDLNVPGALAALFHFVRQVNPMLDGGQFSEAQRQRMLKLLTDLNGVLGVFELEQAASLPEEAAKLIARREKAREERDFSTADQLREELRALGFRVIDTPQGPRCERRDD